MTDFTMESGTMSVNSKEPRFPGSGEAAKMPGFVPAIELYQQERRRAVAQPATEPTRTSSPGPMYVRYLTGHRYLSLGSSSLEFEGGERAIIEKASPPKTRRRRPAKNNPNSLLILELFREYEKPLPRRPQADVAPEPEIASKQNHFLGGDFPECFLPDFALPPLSGEAYQLAMQQLERNDLDEPAERALVRRVLDTHVFYEKEAVRKAEELAAARR